MNYQTLGKLERVTDLRNTWPRENRDFSKWITQEEIMLMLSEATGIDIRFTERESSVNNLSVDILATETMRLQILFRDLKEKFAKALDIIFNYAIIYSRTRR